VAFVEWYYSECSEEQERYCCSVGAYTYRIANESMLFVLFFAFFSLSPEKQERLLPVYVMCYMYGRNRYA